MPKVAFRQVRSRGSLPNWDEVIKEVNRMIDQKTKPELIQLFNWIVANWHNKPTFRARKRVTRQALTIYVYPTGEEAKIWGYVSGGTRPHQIAAKRALRLKFKTGYMPKTLPRQPYFKGPGKAYGPWRAPLVVNHPGNEPRDFEGEIQRDYKPVFSKDMENAFRRGIRRARAQGKGRSRKL